MESEQMYGDKGEVPDGEYTIPLELLISNEGTDVTIVSLENHQRSAHCC
jgi:pyruvate dehydrogenase E1 component beta subunit